MKKFIKLLLILLVSQIALISCGEKEPTKTADGKTILRVAAWDYVAVWWDDLIVEFERLNPDVKVETVEIIAAEYEVKILSMLTGGVDVDVLAIKEMNHYTDYINNGYIKDITKLVETDLPKEGGIDVILEQFKVPFLDNKIFAVPYRSDIFIMFYNKDVFDKAGVAYPSTSMTWNEFRRIAKEITDKTGAFGAYFHTWPAQISNWPVVQKKGELYSGDYKFLKPMYQLVLDMQNKDKSIMTYNSARAGNIHYKGEFEKARAGMILIGSWMFGDFSNLGDDLKWGIAPIPFFPREKPNATFNQPTGMSINANAANPDLAWRFLKFMASKEEAMVLSKLGAYPAYVDQDVLNNFFDIPSFPKDDVSKIALAPEHTAFVPLHPKGARITSILTEAHSLIMSGNVTLDEGIEEMESRVAPLLK